MKRSYFLTSFLYLLVFLILVLSAEMFFLFRSHKLSEISEIKHYILIPNDEIVVKIEKILDDSNIIDSMSFKDNEEIAVELISKYEISDYELFLKANSLPGKLSFSLKSTKDIQRRYEQTKQKIKKLSPDIIFIDKMRPITKILKTNEDLLRVRKYLFVFLGVFFLPLLISLKYKIALKDLKHSKVFLKAGGDPKILSKRINKCDFFLLIFMIFVCFLPYLLIKEFNFAKINFSYFIMFEGLLLTIFSIFTSTLLIKRKIKND